MIIFSERFSFERDPWCWVLSEWTNSICRKDGSPKRTRRKTYHATIKQLADTILDRSSGDCQSIEELKNLFDHASVILTRDMEKKNNDILEKGT